MGSCLATGVPWRAVAARFLRLEKPHPDVISLVGWHAIVPLLPAFQHQIADDMPACRLGGLVAPTLADFRDASEMVPLAAMAGTDGCEIFVKPQVDLLERFAEKAAGLVAMFREFHLQVKNLGRRRIPPPPWMSWVLAEECILVKRPSAGVTPAKVRGAVRWKITGFRNFEGSPWTEPHAPCLAAGFPGGRWRWQFRRAAVRQTLFQAIGTADTLGGKGRRAISTGD